MPGVDMRVCALHVKSYFAILKECLPHVCSEPFVSIAWHIWRHNGVIHEGREMCTHSGQVAAVCQPWSTTQLII